MFCTFIVPCKGYEQTFLQQEARERYLWLLNKAESVEQLSYPEPSEEAFLEAGRRIVAHSDLIVAIWDGQKSVGKVALLTLLNTPDPSASR